MTGAGAPVNKTLWRDHIEAVTVAVVMALVLKYFLVEAYKIPTGSMQPTLMGNESIGLFDRILVDKLSYKWREPARFEVAVFRFPLDRSKNFVKRIVGMPGEELRIYGGDLWTRPLEGGNWNILRKPRSVQAEQWRALDPREPEDCVWSSVGALPEAGGWITSGRSIEAHGAGRANFRPELGALVDHYLDGYPPAVAQLLPTRHPGAGANFVSDLCLEGEVVPEADCAWIELQLEDGPWRHRFLLPGPAAPAGSCPQIQSSERFPTGAAPKQIATTSVGRLLAGRRYRFQAQNLDDLLELALDGEWLLALEIESSEDQRASAALALSGGSARFDELMLSRDLYYTSAYAKVSQVSIPAGYYFMLGDNTQDSADGREWTFDRWRVLAEGESPPQVPENQGQDQELASNVQTPEPLLAGSRILRGYWRRGENPLVVTGGEYGPVTWLVDEFGERHALSPRNAQHLTPEDAPLVPRSMVQGRALAVFWPWWPTQDVYRFRWVH